jgi:hypothetical protein
MFTRCLYFIRTKENSIRPACKLRSRWLPNVFAEVGPERYFTHRPAVPARERGVHDECGAADNEYMDLFARNTFGAFLEGGTRW